MNNNNSETNNFDLYGWTISSAYEDDKLIALAEEISSEKKMEFGEVLKEVWLLQQKALGEDISNVNKTNLTLNTETGFILRMDENYDSDVEQQRENQEDESEQIASATEIIPVENSPSTSEGQYSSYTAFN